MRAQFRWLPFAAAVVAGAVAVACDLTDASDPDIVRPEDLESEAGIATLRAGAIADLHIALSGNASGHGASPGVILFGGMLSDEYFSSSTFPTRNDFDKRSIPPRSVARDPIFGPLHRARASARRAAEAVQEFSDPSQDPRFAEMKALEGLALVFFGEDFCSGVPVSGIADDGTLEFGQPLTIQELFERALQSLDEARGQTGGSDRSANLARVVTGRAMLNVGRFQEAAEVVAPVPTDFQYELEHSGASRVQENGIYSQTAVRRQWSLADGEGENGLPFRSADDPRVPWSRTPGQVGQDGQTPYFNQEKYPSASSPVAAATGIEARLIEAEAALQAGETSTFEQIHNDLRARVGLPEIDADTMSASERVDFHFRERGLWFFSDGHRLGDLRRLVRQYGRAAEDVFPSGPWHKGGTYGTDVNIPIPPQEENNPNFQGCLNRGA